MKNKTILPNIFLGLVLFILFIPIIVVVIYSFNESRLSSVWSGFSLTWYKTLFRDRDIFEALLNSLMLGAAAAFIAGIIGTLGALGMDSRKRRRLNLLPKSIIYISTLPIMIPEIILGMVFMAYFTLIGLNFGMLTLIIAHSAFCIPYVYTMVQARLAGMDKGLVEAARDLGATGPRAFFDITLPLLMPAVLSGMLLSFAMSFDDVIISIFVTGVNVNTLPIKIYSQLKTGVTPEINALCTLMLVFTIIIVVLSLSIRQKHK